MTYQEMKVKATELGIEYSNTIKKDELEQLIAEKEELLGMEAKMATYELPKEKVSVKPAAVKKDYRQEALRMVKCIITPLSESQRLLPSDMFAVGNKNVGFIKKVVRFGVETIEPVIILKTLKETQMLVAQKTTVDGKETIVNRLVPAFSIQEIPFTDEELEAFKNNK